MRGVVRLCLLSTACHDFVELVFTQPTSNGTVGIGIGGVITIGGGGPLRISIVAAPWTLATVTVIDQITTPGGAEALAGVTFAGFVHDPVSGTTSTAQPGGAVQLVTPAQVETTVRLGSVRKIASGLVLRIRFLPEPGLLLLLGSGVAGLALLGVARRQRG